MSVLEKKYMTKCTPVKDNDSDKELGTLTIS